MKNQLQKLLTSSEEKKTRLENPRKLQALYLFPLCSRLQQHWKITPCGMQEPTVMSLGDYLAFLNFCIPNLVMLSIGTYGSENLSSSQRWAGSGLWQIWVPVVYIFHSSMFSENHIGKLELVTGEPGRAAQWIKCLTLKNLSSESQNTQ